MLNDYVKKNDEKIAYRVIDDEAVIVNLKESSFHTLNPVGTFIWDQIDGKTSVTMIIQNVTDEFGIDSETAEKDSKEFIDNLLKKDLVILSGSTE
jgi:hypothetical protein